MQKLHIIVSLYLSFETTSAQLLEIQLSREPFATLDIRSYKDQQYVGNLFFGADMQKAGNPPTEIKM